jgi:ABC-type uncharacterized transport system permease subunit
MTTRAADEDQHRGKGFPLFINSMSPISFFGLALIFYFLGCLLFLIDLWDRKEGKVAEPNPKEEESSYMEDIPDEVRKRYRRGRRFEEPAASSLSSETTVAEIAQLGVSQRLAFMATGIGFLFHTAALIIQVQAGVPFSTGKEALSFFAWAMVLLSSLVELRYKMYIMGSFVLPVAFLFLISAATITNEKQAIAPTLKGALLGVHTTLSLLGIVAFAIAAVVGVMYLLQEKLLKSKQFIPLYDKLPPLDLLDQLNKTVLFCGFPLFTLGMITGALWSQYALGAFWSSNNPKQILSIFTWLFYLITLHGRMTIGWKAKKAAHLAIAGFIGILFIFVTLV